MTVDDHLESALEEYNQRICELEERGNRTDLLEAYVNRGSILVMMEHYISALHDFEDAAELASTMRKEDVDPGTFVKIYVNIGRMSDGQKMIGSYRKASERIEEMNVRSRQYDTERVVELCISCSSDLMSEGSDADAVPFLKKALSVLMGKDDAWSLNRIAEVYDLIGQLKRPSDRNDSISAFETSAEIAEQLFSEKELEDPLELVSTYITIGDIYEETGLYDQSILHYEKAADILEMLYSEGSLDDPELLISIHRGLASSLMTAGSDKEAELHLLRAAEIEARSL